MSEKKRMNCDVCSDVQKILVLQQWFGLNDWMAFEPRASKRETCVKEHRTKIDYPHFMKELAQQYPNAKSIIRLFAVSCG